MIEITKNENAQLRLVDSLIDVHSYQRAIRGIQEQLYENDRLIADALSARAKAEEIWQEIATLSEQVTNIDQLLSNPLLVEMRQAEAKEGMFVKQLAYVDELIVLQKRYEQEIKVLSLPVLPEEFSTDEILKKVSIASQSVEQDFLASLGTIGQTLADAHKSITDAKAVWNTQFELLRQKCREAFQGSDQARLEVERNRLLEEKQKAENELARYRKLAEEDLPELQRQRVGLLEDLDNQYQAYYETRKEKFDRLTASSDGKLKLTLTHATNRAVYIDALTNLLSGSGSSTISTVNRQKIAEAIPPYILGEIIMDRDFSRLASDSGISQTMAERAMDKLWAYDDFSEVLKIQHAYYPEDAPIIEFNKGNGEFAKLNELSVGQKCTALLIIALCDGSIPVLIDQPEDALDIASVWEDIAKKLRRGKYGRQFVLTTHNSSLAVGGDSDNFMILQPQSGDRARISVRGAIDRKDVRDAVINHLEGGSEPYKLRQRKYNID